MGTVLFDTFLGSYKDRGRFPVFCVIILMTGLMWRDRLCIPLDVLRKKIFRRY